MTTTMRLVIVFGIVTLFLLPLSLSVSSSSSISTSSSVMSPRTSSRRRSSVSRQRKLEQYDDDDYFQYDLSNFSLRFEKCQFVKMYDDEYDNDNNDNNDNGQAQNNKAPLALKHFIVYKLCPSSNVRCMENSGQEEECGKCDEVYGTYTTTIDDYLTYTIENQRNSFENMCNNCNNNDDCYEVCYQYENLEDLGYIDASEYTECQQYQPQEDDNDDNNYYYYIGPRCSNSGITIGVFSDANCWEPLDDDDVDVEELLGGKLSYHLLRHVTYNSDESPVCLSCSEDDENADANNENDEQDADNVNEMCEMLYSSSAKCESESGLSSGFIQMNVDAENYENQVENEFMSCTFIQSLIWNSYNEIGEIIVDKDQDVIIRQITKKQTWTLSILTLLTLSLLCIWYYLEKQITKIISHNEHEQVLLKQNKDGTMA